MLRDSGSKRNLIFSLKGKRIYHFLHVLGKAHGIDCNPQKEEFNFVWNFQNMIKNSTMENITVLRNEVKLNKKFLE
jgi:hypothetical protein